MFFSKTCEYAIRAVLFIANRSEDAPKAGIQEIAQGIDSPGHFIAKILQVLVRNGLIQSTKGPNGGFYIDSQNRQYTLADIVKVVDGERLFKGCGLGLSQCSETKPCPLHESFKGIRQQIYETLTSTKIGEFNEALNQGLQYLKER
ncbi:Rrf2 family protein [Dyadobacter jejuensis]|uniref:Rrf2 family protein n=1 Tax=Dyadobacter jejuensis TaxID=1082580 RepID=A0A316AR10_9BACT|nr:Rrf2 family transcriptional regulator [Dyadobacter jejuensis]PWJ59871.1 Rrf2 family protein [Dyadobacter jejuensis]